MADNDLTLYERDEYLIKDEFRKTFNQDYLAWMRIKTPDIDEILWMAFAHGWVAKAEHEED